METKSLQRNHKHELESKRLHLLQWRMQTRHLGGAVKLRGAKNVFTCLNTKGCLQWRTQKLFMGGVSFSGIG